MTHPPSDDEPTESHPAVAFTELEKSERPAVVRPECVRGRIAPIRLGPLDMDRLRALDTYAAEIEAQKNAIAQREAEARARGWREGFEESSRKNTQAFLDWMAAFEQRIAEMENRLPRAILDMAARLAARCLGKELTENDEAWMHWVRSHAAGLMPAAGVACLHAAADAARLRPLQDALAREFPHTRFDWRADPELAPGEILLESENLRVDARLDALEARLRRTLAEPPGAGDA